MRARTDLQIPADAVVVTTVGRLTAIKQHSLFLEMAARLASRSSRLLFLIVGDGELRVDLEAMARAAGLDACVRFVGWWKPRAGNGRCPQPRLRGNATKL